MGYFDYATLKRQRDEAIRRLPPSVREQMWAWLVLFTDRDSAGVVKEEFHRLALEPMLPEQAPRERS